MIDPVRQHIELPAGLLEDACTPGPVKKALTAWMDLRGQHRDAGRALGEAQHVVEAAEAADTQALADAIRKGGKEPAATASKAREHLQAAERRIKAVEQAIRDAFAAATGVIDEHAAKWREALEQLEAEQRRAWLEAIDAVVLGEYRVRSTLTTSVWLREFPARATPKPPASLAFVHGLTQPNGDAPSTIDVVTALRDLAERGGGPPLPANRLMPGVDQRVFPPPDAHGTPSGKPGLPGNTAHVTADGATLIVPEAA